MSIRPTDLQVVLPKLGEASRVHRAEDNGQYGQHLTNAQFQKEIQAAENRIRETRQSEKGRIQGEGKKGRQPASGQEKRQNSKENRASKKQKDGVCLSGGPGQIIDIQL